MNYKYKDIDKIYTDIVSEYLQKGYIIYSSCMAGHQGEIVKIILSNSNDNELICIYMKELYLYEKGNKIILIIGKYNYKPYSMYRDDVIWLDKLETIKEFTFYEIDEYKHFYTDDIDFFKECKKKQDARLILNYEINKEKSFEFKSKQAFLIAYRHCKKTKGYKTVKAKDILAVLKENNKKYRIKINNKDDLIIRF